MTDTTVKCFLSLCETQNFTHTAELMFMSQQAVSKQIGSLERELGHRLFLRGYNGARLTEAGEIYRRMFTRWKEEYDAASEAVSRLEGGQDRGIRIGYLPRVRLPEPVDDMIFRFKQQNPEISIDYSQIAGADMVSALRDNLADFCIAHSFLLDKEPEFELCSLCRVKKQIAISVHHPLYTDPVDTSRFSEMTYLYELMEDKTEASERDEMTAIFAQFGSVPRTMRQLKNHEVLELAVQMGEGITICSDVTSLPRRDRIRTVDTRDISILSVAWSRDNNRPAVRQLIKAFRKIGI